MKQGLSTGDITNATVSDGVSNGVFKQVRSRRKKPRNLDTSLTQADVDMSSSNTQVQQSIHQNINTTTDADQNSSTVALISQLQKTVEDLSSVVQSQQRTIAALSCKLNFVLSFLDIQEGRTNVMNSTECTDNRPTSDGNATVGSDVRPVRDTQSVRDDGNSGTVMSYATATATATVKTPQNTKSQPTNFHEAVAVAMYTDQRDKERRAKSVVITGLSPCSDKSDGMSFSHLCSSEFGMDPQVTFTRRLGARKVGYIQPLLVGLQSTDDVSLIMTHAKSLRRSLVQSVRENVFINRNLTKIEGRLAYEERCRRRQRRQSQMNVVATSDQVDESVSFVNNDSRTHATPASIQAPPLNPSAVTFLPTATAGSLAGVTDN